MTPKIFLGHDFYGAGNFGDDLMLDGFLRSLASHGRQATVCCSIPHDVDSQRRRFPAIQWHSASSQPHREEQLREADLWLGLGDTPFQVESGPWSLDHLDRERERCKRLGKPMLFLGVGCNSPDALLDPRGRRVIETAERIWTRDARSADAISVVAAAGVVSAGADLAHIALGAAMRPAPENGLLGLLLGLQAPGIVDIAAVEQVIARRLPAKTRWLVQEARSFPCTERWNYAALSERMQRSVSLMPMEYAMDTTEEFLANFGAPETVVSSRYHGALIAAWHACRLGVIVRTDKMLGVIADLDVPYVRRISEADELEALAREALPVQPSRLQALRDRADAMCNEFFSWCDSSRETSHPKEYRARHDEIEPRAA